MTNRDDAEKTFKELETKKQIQELIQQFNDYCASNNKKIEELKNKRRNNRR